MRPWHVLKSLLSVIYTPRCIVCGTSTLDRCLCKDCLDNIHFLCREVSTPVRRYYSRLFAVAAYEGPMLAVVHKFKYGRGRAAVRIVSDLLKEHIRWFDDVECIVPVPQSMRRYIKRGYNQSVIIAQMVSRLTGKPVFARALVKAAHTPPQVGKSLGERKDNLVAAFAAPHFRAQSVKNRNVLLVDDVVTSGATIDECARVLLKSGASKVDVLTVAKTL